MRHFITVNSNTASIIFSLNLSIKMIETQRNEAPEITEEEPINILDEISFWLEEKAIFMLYLPEYINETLVLIHWSLVSMFQFSAKFVEWHFITWLLSLYVLQHSLWVSLFCLKVGILSRKKCYNFSISDIEDSTKYNSVQIYWDRDNYNMESLLQ